MNRLKAYDAGHLVELSKHRLLLPCCLSQGRAQPQQMPISWREHADYKGCSPVCDDLTDGVEEGVLCSLALALRWLSFPKKERLIVYGSGGLEETHSSETPGKFFNY